MEYVLGVDGGNTKTLALVARLDGTIVGSGRDGSTNIYVGEPTVASLPKLGLAVDAALAMAGICAADLATSCFSMSGADWPEDIAFIETAVHERGYGRTITVVNDAIGALRAGSPTGWGVVVACGTGAAVGARAPDGRSWHSGYWQDPEGAEDLANKTLKAVYRTALGIDGPTRLTERVLAYFEQRTVEDVLHLLTARGTNPRRRGGLARDLFEEAANGDETARLIVERHGVGLGDFALAAARHVGIEGTAFPLVLGGQRPAPSIKAAQRGDCGACAPIRPWRAACGNALRAGVRRAPAGPGGSGRCDRYVGRSADCGKHAACDIFRNVTYGSRKLY